MIFPIYTLFLAYASDPILAGELQVAKVLATATATTADFTTPRKSALLNLIDTALTTI